MQKIDLNGGMSAFAWAMQEKERMERERAAEGKPTAAIDTNERGGKQSAIGVRLDLLPADAVKAVGARLALGADRYEKNNWRLIGVDDHLNHALRHILNALATRDGVYEVRHIGPAGDDVPYDADRETPYHELSAAACRLLMALEVYCNGQWEKL